MPPRRPTPTSQAAPVPYVPPQPTLAPCPTCGACVLVRFLREGAMVELAEAVTPCLGVPHHCTQETL